MSPTVAFLSSLKTFSSPGDHWQGNYSLALGVFSEPIRHVHVPKALFVDGCRYMDKKGGYFQFSIRANLLYNSARQRMYAFPNS